MFLFKKDATYVAMRSTDQLREGQLYSVRSEHKVDNKPEHSSVILTLKKDFKDPHSLVYRVPTQVAMSVLHRVHIGKPHAKDLLDHAASLKNILNLVFYIFPKAFINGNDELIFVPKHNIYINLTDVLSYTDFEMKCLAWLSRPISKGLKRKPANKLLDRFNRLLNTQFTMSDMELIYARLGNNVNPELSAAFIRSGYDMDLLTQDKEATL